MLLNPRSARDVIVDICSNENNLYRGEPNNLLAILFNDVRDVCLKRF